MSYEITTAFQQQYSNLLEQLLQQRGSRLRSTVREQSHSGKAAKTVEQVGAVSAVKRTTRHGDTPLISTPHSARWVFPTDYEWADLIDDQDKLRMLIDPASMYMTNARDALGRSIDETIIEAFFGDARTGENGTDVTSFDTANQQIATGSKGLTVDKLREAMKILLSNEVDVMNDPLCIAVTAKQHDDLLAETQTTSLDYNTRPVLVEGRISRFMGFDFVHTELLGVDGSDNRRVPAYAKSGMTLGIWNDINGRIDPRADKSYSTQVYAKGTWGATRTQEGKVVEILCDES